MYRCAVIIPALNPPESLVEYVKTLSKNISHVIVVNDGSKQELAPIFTELSLLERCTVLTHKKNQGKGRALKTAFQYFLNELSDLTGVVTADADGQHAVVDVWNVAEELDKTEDIILGVRDFNDPDVPVRSYIGNRIATILYQFFYGAKLRDTQTGLRGIPKNVIPEMIHLKGERYEYEINMLIFAQKRQLTINEIPIQTLYFNHNSGSHYHSIKDSLRVFKKLLSGLILYSFATLASGFIDIVSFILFNRFFADQPLQVRLFWATFLARTLSYFCNFLMNRTFVFKGGNQFIQSIVKYYVLFFGFITSSYFFVLSANLYLNVNIILTKILVDGQALLKCINGYIYWQQLSSCFFGSIRKGNFHSVRIWAKNRYFV